MNIETKAIIRKIIIVKTYKNLRKKIIIGLAMTALVVPIVTIPTIVLLSKKADKPKTPDLFDEFSKSKVQRDVLNELKNEFNEKLTNQINDSLKNDMYASTHEDFSAINSRNRNNYDFNFLGYKNLSETFHINKGGEDLNDIKFQKQTYAPTWNENEIKNLDRTKANLINDITKLFDFKSVIESVDRNVMIGNVNTQFKPNAQLMSNFSIKNLKITRRQGPILNKDKDGKPINGKENLYRQFTIEFAFWYRINTRSLDGNSDESWEVDPLNVKINVGADSVLKELKYEIWNNLNLHTMSEYESINTDFLHTNFTAESLKTVDTSFKTFSQKTLNNNIRKSLVNQQLINKDKIIARLNTLGFKNTKGINFKTPQNNQLISSINPQNNPQNNFKRFWDQQTRTDFYYDTNFIIERTPQNNRLFTDLILKETGAEFLDKQQAINSLKLMTAGNDKRGQVKADQTYNNYSNQILTNFNDGNFLKLRDKEGQIVKDSNVRDVNFLGKISKQIVDYGTLTFDLNLDIENGNSIVISGISLPWTYRAEMNKNSVDQYLGAIYEALKVYNEVGGLQFSKNQKQELYTATKAFKKGLFDASYLPTNENNKVADWSRFFRNVHGNKTILTAGREQVGTVRSRHYNFNTNYNDQLTSKIEYPFDDFSLILATQSYVFPISQGGGNNWRPSTLILKTLKPSSNYGITFDTNDNNVELYIRLSLGGFHLTHYLLSENQSFSLGNHTKTSNNDKNLNPIKKTMTKFNDKIVEWQHKDNNNIRENKFLFKL